MQHKTTSPKETQAIATLLGRELGNAHIHRSGALIIAFTGDLGSGKTTFIQGFARGVGIKRRMVSPTFTLMRRYAIPKTSPAYRSGFRSLVHMDAYRVHTPRELTVIRFGDWISDPTAIVLIEWAELVRRLIPKTALSVRFSHGTRENQRTIAIGR
jgi:tRNA threonylcarbamoyladenosine biosynthesis protein TsaE